MHILVDGRGRRWRHFIALCEGRRQPPAAGPAWFETTMTVLFCLQRGRGRGGEWVMDDCKKGERAEEILAGKGLRRRPACTLNVRRKKKGEGEEERGP